MQAEQKNTLKSWVTVAQDSPFSIQNLPYGIFRPSADAAARVGVAIGEQILDLSVLASNGFFKSNTLNNGECFKETTLNTFMELGRAAWTEARTIITDILKVGASETLPTGALVLQSDAKMELPARIGDYTDFYASRNHATNVGIMFRGVDNALQPNWTHLPVGYHGRASSVVVSGKDMIRPRGQTVAKDAPRGPPSYTACKLMDFELEMGCFVGGKANEIGHPVTMEEAKDRLFGVVLLNDWSARDIQKWEYVPLGPFGGKNFGTTISPWVVTFDALAPFQLPIEQDPKPLPYLQEEKAENGGVFTYDINLKVTIQSEKMDAPHTISNSNLKYLSWSFAQMLTHHSVTGCNMTAGDLLGSGTISGTTPGSYGSMLEICWKGTKTVDLPGGETRKFLADNDTVALEGYCQGEGYRVGFGDCIGKVLPALPSKY